PWLDRQAHDKRCALGMQGGTANNLSSMLAHNPVTDAQAQACPFADLFCRKKRIEDPFGMRDARSVIAEGNFNRAVSPGSCDLNARVAANFAHRVICIVQNVQKHLLKLVRVSNDVRQFLIKLLNHFDPVALEIVKAQLHRAMKNRVELYRLTLRRHLPSEAQ